MAVTLESWEPVGVIRMEARPSPVAVTPQTWAPQPRAAEPPVTSYVTVTPPAGERSGPRAVTVNGVGTPMGTWPEGAARRVRASPEPES